jgi:hypothetical protein
VEHSFFSSETSLNFFKVQGRNLLFSIQFSVKKLFAADQKDPQFKVPVLITGI